MLRCFFRHILGATAQDSSVIASFRVGATALSSSFPADPAGRGMYSFSSTGTFENKFPWISLLSFIFSALLRLLCLSVPFWTLQVRNWKRLQMKSACCSYKGPACSTQFSQWLTPVPGDLLPSFGLCGYTHTGKTLRHIRSNTRTTWWDLLMDSWTTGVISLLWGNENFPGVCGLVTVSSLGNKKQRHVELSFASSIF